MLGNMLQYRTLVSAVGALLEQEASCTDPVGVDLVNKAVQSVCDWTALTPKLRRWLGRKDARKDAGDYGALIQDPRVARYAVLLLLSRALERVRQADFDAGVGVFKELTRAVKILPQLEQMVADWPAHLRVEGVSGMPAERDPGCGTGHREW